jgi:hypothetical protein
MKRPMVAGFLSCSPTSFPTSGNYVAYFPRRSISVAPLPRPAIAEGLWDDISIRINRQGKMIMGQAGRRLKGGPRDLWPRCFNGERQGGERLLQVEANAFMRLLSACEITCHSFGLVRVLSNLTPTTNVRIGGAP